MPIGEVSGARASVKTSVTLSLEDLDEALRRGVNVSAVARQALREHLDELTDEENIVGCAAALADTETDAARSDTTIGDRIGPDKS